MRRHIWTWTLGAGLGFAALSWPALVNAQSATEPAKDNLEKAADDATKTADKAIDRANDTADDQPDLDRPSDAARDTTDAARDTARDTSDKARDAADKTRDATRDTSNKARDAARDAERDVRNGARDTTDAARDRVRDTDRDVRDERDNDDRDNNTTRDRNDNRDARDRNADVDRNNNRDRDNRDRDNRDVHDRDNRRDNSNFDVSTARAADVGLWVSARKNNLLITDVGTTGPIARLGFRENDYIYSINGTRVHNEREFMQYLFADDVIDNRVNVTVYRGGRYQTINVQPRVLIEEQTTTQQDPLETFGLLLDDRYTDRLVVWKVLPRTPAYYAGFRSGDVIRAWDGNRLSDSQDFIHNVENIGAGEITVQVVRQQRVRNMTVDIPETYITNRHTTLRTDYDDLDNNDNNRIDRRDIRQENREERRDLIDDTRTVPGNVVTPVPGTNSNIDVNVTPRRGILPRRP